MIPVLLVNLGLIIQGATIGTGAINLLYLRSRGRLAWLPLVLIFAYYVFLLLYPSASLRPPPKVPNPHAMTDAVRYLVLVASFSSTVLWLMFAARRADRRERAAVAAQQQALRERNQARTWVHAIQVRHGEPLTDWRLVGKEDS